MKKVFEIIGVNDMVLDRVEGTLKQVEAFKDLMYSEAQIREFKPRDLDALHFDGDSDLLSVHDGDTHLSTISVEDETFFIIDEDTWSKVAEFPREQIELLGNAKRLFSCEECDNTGETTSTGFGCTVAVTDCCGGCEFPVSCECEEVIYNF